ncbi:hypothetical protein [Streptomyces lunalinharesii]|uniref:Uncharacterized protein n=1 Tax=Streptomyces lunalinharesii TaxID=333384 RepID=A0ABN3SBU8_9ACTN
MSEPQHDQHSSGPVFNGAVSGSQFAWNNETAHQNQQNVGGATPGFEALTALVTDLLRELPRVGLAAQDRADTEEAARAVLATLAEPTPPQAGRLRQALAVLKGVLAPVATGLAAGTAAGAQDWARTAIEGLTHSL